MIFFIFHIYSGNVRENVTASALPEGKKLKFGCKHSYHQAALSQAVYDISCHI